MAYSQAVTASECDQMPASWAYAQCQALSWAQQVGKQSHPDLAFPIATEGTMVPAMVALTQSREWQWMDKDLGWPGGGGLHLSLWRFQQGSHFSWSLPIEKWMRKASQMVGTVRMEVG